MIALAYFNGQVLRNNSVLLIFYILYLFFPDGMQFHLGIGPKQMKTIYVEFVKPILNVVVQIAQFLGKSALQVIDLFLIVYVILFILIQFLETVCIYFTSTALLIGLNYRKKKHQVLHNVRYVDKNGHLIFSVQFK